jgi:catechol 2,3-dioxygenase-like lactoylglutathione lyase family enzyme
MAPMTRVVDALRNGCQWNPATVAVTVRCPGSYNRFMLEHADAATRLPARDLTRARTFYREKLGLETVDERPGGLLYRCGRSDFALFESSGSSRGEFTQMGWAVGDLRATVDALRARGVVFEEVDLPGLKTVDGIARIAGNYRSKGGVGELGAWFRDSEGNMLGIGQPLGDTTPVVRRLFAAFARDDRAAFEALLHDEFTFSSPDDPQLDKAGYFRRCWPGAKLVRSIRIERLTEDGDEVFVKYAAEFAGRPPFRNVEQIRIEDGRVKRIEVYYGVARAEAPDADRS